MAYRSRIVEFLRLSNAMAPFGTQNCDFSSFFMFFVNCDVPRDMFCGFHALLRATFDAESISGSPEAIQCDLANLERGVTLMFDI